MSRREFVMVCAAAIVTLLAPSRTARAAVLAPHPKPRRGITAAKVLTKAQLAKHPKAIPVFESVRKIPHIVDGIRCNCGCGHPPEMYSLLSCFEGDAMAIECAVCQGQGKLAARLHTEGKTLNEIRTAVDAKFG